MNNAPGGLGMLPYPFGHRGWLYATSQVSAVGRIVILQKIRLTSMLVAAGGTMP
jgi:hypothetical protein